MKHIFFSIPLILTCIITSGQTQKKGSGTIKYKYDNDIHINLHLPGGAGHDTILFKFYTTILDDNYPSANNNSFVQVEKYIILDANRKADFTIPKVDKPGYLLIAKNDLPYSREYYPLIRYYVVEPGDSIQIKISSRNGFENLYSQKIDFEFYGKGAATLYCQKEINDLRITGGPFVNAAGNFNPENSSFRYMEQSLQVLSKYESKISSRSYKLLESNLVGYARNRAAYDILLVQSNYRKDTAVQKLLLEALNRITPENNSSLYIASVSGSNTYPAYILNFEKAKWLVLNGSLSKDFYYLLKEKYKGELREKLLIMLLLSGNKNISFDKALFEDALSTVKNPLLLEKLKEAGNRMEGSTAPDFSLPDPSGKIISLHDFKGKVVFIDFWYTGCTACAGYYKLNVKDVEEKFSSNKEVVFITICIDRRKTEWINSMNEGIYTSNKVINLYTEGQADDHPMIKHYNISGCPTPIIIDRDGKIFKYGWVLREKETLIQSLISALEPKK